MKPALLAVGLAAALAVSASGCLHADDEAPPHERLEALGFLDYADPSRRESLGRELRRDPESVVFAEGTNRFFIADAEDLAEGGVGALLVELGPTLSRLDARLFDVRERLRLSYTVTVFGRKVTMYTEAENDREDAEPGITWGLTAARTVQLVNDLLRDAGSTERAWGYSGGNDFGVFILTPELRDAVADTLDSPSDEPYEPTEDYPRFGQPEG